MNQTNVASSDEVSLKDIIKSISRGTEYIFSKWIIVLVVTVIGGAIGYYYNSKKIPSFSAVCTFIIDGGSSGQQAGGLQGLPQLLGTQSMGGSQNTGGILSLFQTNNYPALYKSRRIVESTMLSEGVFGKKKQLLIDYYIDIKKYRTNPALRNQYKNLDFHKKRELFTVEQNVVLNTIIEEIKKTFTIQPGEVGAPVLSIKVSSEDELFAKVFSEKLLESVNIFYIESKNYKLKENIDVIERNADSLKRALFRAMGDVASATEQTPNINSAYQTIRLPPQRKQVEVSYLQGLYGTAASDLALAKNEMRKIQPFILILDKPILPLPVNIPNKIAGLFLGSLTAFFSTVLTLILVLVVKDQLSK